MSQNALSQGLSIDLNPTPYYLSKPEDKATPPIDIPPLKTSADVYTASQRLAQPRAEAESGVLKAQLGMEENVATQKAKAAEGVATEAHKTADAYQKRLSEFPYPEFHPTKDNVQSLAGLFSIVSTLGLMLGHSGKMSGMTALKSMKGMMDGWQKGRADLFKYEAENFQKNFARMKAVHDDLKSDFDEYMKLLPIDREAAMYKAEEIARKAGTNSIITANLQRGKLNVVQENIDAAGKLIAEKEKKAEEVRVRERERLLSEAFQEKLQRERLDAEAQRRLAEMGTAGPRAAIYQATGKILPEKEAVQVSQGAAALRLVTSLRKRLKDPEVETGLKDLSTSFFQKLKSITSPEELDQAINQLDSNDKTLLFLKDSAILGLTIEQSLTGTRVPVFTQRMMGPIFDAKAYTKPAYDKLLSSREEQLYDVAEDFGFTRDELSKYARVGSQEEPVKAETSVSEEDITATMAATKLPRPEVLKRLKAKGHAVPES